jgi:hypothetical protein
MAGCQRGKAIPTQLGLGQFEQFVLPHLAMIEKQLVAGLVIKYCNGLVFCVADVDLPI